MTRLSTIYYLREMARTHGAVAGGGPAIHGMLDWASEQDGEFTVKDLLQAYINAGGQSISVPGFTIQAKKYVANIDPETNMMTNEPPSVQKPIIMTKQGAKGRGNPSYYAWGLDGPLRKAPEKKPVSNDPLLQVKTKVEDQIGVSAYRSAIARWKQLGNLNKISADIRATIPARFQMDALHIAATMLHSGEDEVDDAEHEIETPFRTPGVRANVPKHVPKPKVQPASSQTAAPSPTKGGEGEGDVDDIPADFFQSLSGDDSDVADDEEPEKTPASGDAETSAEPEDEQPADDETPRDSDSSEQEYPIFLPDPDDEGDKYENAMFRVVSETDINEYDPIWEELKNAKDALDAHSIIKKSKIPPNLHRSALLVAHAIFDNTGRDWETGKKNESRLAAIYGMAEGGHQDNLDHVDFAVQSGLKRIMKIRK